MKKVSLRSVVCIGAAIQCFLVLPLILKLSVFTESTTPLKKTALPIVSANSTATLPANRIEMKETTQKTTRKISIATALLPAKMKETSSRRLNTAMNPGCIARKLCKYRPIDTGRVYSHPSIIQYAKLSTGKTSTSEFTFMEYMAMMSAYKFLHPQKIIIHAYTSIAGKYWDYTQKWNTSVEVKRVERVSTVGGKRLRYITHQADFIKLRGLLEFGGVISDFDVIVINGTTLNKMQRISECVLSLEVYETGHGHHPSGFQGWVNAGFSSCIRNSSFVREWLDGYYKRYSTKWMYNASYRPTEILEKNTATCYNVYAVDNIATNPRWSHYKDWLEYKGVKWREKIAAHYYNQTMKEFDEHALQRNNSFGELLRYVENA